MPSGRGRKSTQPESARRDPSRRDDERYEPELQPIARHSTAPRRPPPPSQPNQSIQDPPRMDRDASRYPYVIHDSQSRRSPSRHGSSRPEIDDHSPPHRLVQPRYKDSTDPGPNAGREGLAVIEVSALHRLGSLARGFVAIGLTDLVQCIRYVRDHPDILRVDPNTLSATATELFEKGEDELATQCIQRLLMLRHCQRNSLSDVRSAAEYIKDISERSEIRGELQRDMNTVSAALQPGRNFASHAQNNARSYAPVQQSPIRSQSYGEHDDRHAQRLPIRSQSYAEHDGRLSTRPEFDRQIQHAGSNIPRGLPAPTIQSAQPQSYRSTGRPKVAESPPRSSNERLLIMAGEYQLPSAYEPERNPRIQAQSNSSHHLDMAPSIQRPAVNSNFQPGQGNPRRRTGDDVPTQMTPPMNPEHQGYSTNNAAVNIHDGDPSLVDRSKIEMKESTTDSRTGYSVRNHDAKSFFSLGRVFKLWWYQPAGTDLRGNLNSSSGTTQELGNSNVFYKEMWMLVVVRRNGYSLCCPISTYNGSGVTKTGLPSIEVRAHAIIYSDGQDIIEYEGEGDLLGKDSIPVHMDQGRWPLHPASRVHFGKFHTVEWNVPVRSLGRVPPDYRDLVRDYFMGELLRNSAPSPRQPPPNPPATQGQPPHHGQQHRPRGGGGGPPPSRGRHM